MPDTPSVHRESRPDRISQPLDLLPIEYSLLGTEDCTPVRVAEGSPRPGPRLQITRDDVEMDLPDLIHEESKVVQIRMEEHVEHLDKAADLPVQFEPLFLLKICDRPTRSIEHDHRLAQEVLVPIDGDGPQIATLNQALWDETIRCLLTHAASMSSQPTPSLELYRARA